MRLSFSARAVSIRIGTPESLRIDLARSKPVSPGIITSRMSRSKRSPSSLARALALALLDVALVDQLLEHAAKRLLGDLEDVEQRRNLHARVAIDEMQHPVMRAAEAELRQHVVGVADEVAIGKKQELDHVPDRLAARFRVGLGRGGPAGGGSQIYVRPFGIFWFVCFPKPRFREMNLLAIP